MYQLIKTISSTNGGEPSVNSVKRIEDNSFIPFDSANADYQAYLKWLDGYEWKMIAPMKMEWVKTAESNTPLPADE
ncbi:hypothetical protein UFOVP767_35 [uncultured Caudovirales phage]|uniref:Uncharacterized protein n=1 Tax=uncultured Caudovirales phage TaxID=2100421 RepID=A0A6J5NPK4_9CAUD|nr:hypothetical protein UFOVP767_35 [uncultured Caudovirales phage]